MSRLGSPGAGRESGGRKAIDVALGTKTPPQPWSWDNDGNDGSGLRLRPAGSGGKSLAAPERDVITTPVPTVALLAAARAMTEPEPPVDLGLERAVRESRIPPAPGLHFEADPPSSRRPSSRRASSHGPSLLPSEPFEFELTPRAMRNSRAAPPLAEELGLDHLLADFKPRRSGWQWLRAYGVWGVAAVLVLWLIVTFAASWLPR